jgi:Fe-S cluster assembly ATP-binding protein
MMKGKIVRSGDTSLMKKIDTEGYDWLKEELGIDDERVIVEEKEERVLLGVCATKEALDL